MVLIGMTVSGARPEPKLASSEACFETERITPLATLRPGLAVTSLYMGPFVAALTPLPVLAGPYHRIDGAIVENIAIFASPPDEAARRLRALQARYVVHCTRAKGVDAADPGSLSGQLTAGRVPEFLRELDVSSSIIRVFELIPLPR
jgi:hypothetical protein